MIELIYVPNHTNTVHGKISKFIKLDYLPRTKDEFVIDIEDEPYFYFIVNQVQHRMCDDIQCIRIFLSLGIGDHKLEDESEIMNILIEKGGFKDIG